MLLELFSLLFFLLLFFFLLLLFFLLFYNRVLSTKVENKLTLISTKHSCIPHLNTILFFFLFQSKTSNPNSQNIFKIKTPSILSNNTSQLLFTLVSPCRLYRYLSSNLSLDSILVHSTPHRVPSQAFPTAHNLLSYENKRIKSHMRQITKYAPGPNTQCGVQSYTPCCLYLSQSTSNGEALEMTKS